MGEWVVADVGVRGRGMSRRGGGVGSWLVSGGWEGELE
jgi:hypothetical protein